MKFIGALAVYHAKKKEQIGYLKYWILMIKINLYPHNLDTSVCLEGQSDQGVTQLVIKPFSISQTSKKLFHLFF